MNTQPFIRCRLLSLVAMLTVITMLSTAGYGQMTLCDTCPPVPTDDANNPGGTAGVPWTGGWITATINGCTVEICYACRQTSPVNFDYVVTQICVDSICFANSGVTNWSLWLRDATRALFLANPCNFPCPSCPSNIFYWQENYLTCWRTVRIISPTGQVRFVRKYCDSHGWCLHRYNVCCDEQGMHFNHVSSQTVDVDCAPQGCTSLECPLPM